MKIVITGGAGFVASHLAEAEVLKGNSVSVIDVASNEKVHHLLQHPNFTYIQGSMLDKSVMEPLVEQCDLIYHFGAIANVQIYCTDPVRVLDTNIGGIKLACELAYKYNKKLVFSSSSEVFGKNPKIPWNEDDDSVVGSTKRSRWCYSHTKIIGEHYCLGYAKKGLKIAICRFFNFYGPRLDDLGQGRVITCFLDMFLNNKPVTVVEPGTQTRCFTYVSDGVAGIMEVAHNPKAEGEVFNIGTDVETSMIELAYLMKEVGAFESPIVKVKPDEIYGKGYDDIMRRVPDVSRIKSLGWAPKIDLKEGLKHTIDFFRNK